ncbi:putative mandelate racemase/muconate lactonizing enzyme [Kockovaella imperatae]|uniref:Putative mandelate racemase/muconate lactonizing enzyme n=1 Tax=Kockovaella imperatae TaxID=4999 RepID=A0A1Y1UQ73_9TREE|nr:putative mandelate racemase/muconate lactonizing enzyme [Kockovaella imperatae]ORX39717.1 putative mandelate racemase/muconate lactonizing enzyme [Kockovaella imperatae]
MSGMKITSFSVHDIRFPTNVTGDGTDAMNKECDYSAAYIVIKTSGELQGQGMTFTIGRGNEICCFAIEQVAKRIVGMDVETIFGDMGAFFEFLTMDPQHRWLGPEKGVIALATAAVSNAIWDMMAKSRKKPLWKLICDFTPEEFVKCCAWKYISDAITKEEALELLRAKESGKKAREEEVIKRGYPAYTTSAGWLGYSDEKVKRLVLEGLAEGFNHFKLKVGADPEDDLRRGLLIRSLIDDPANRPKDKVIDPKTIAGKNASATGCVLMVDANQVWDVPQAIEYMKKLEPIKPWFIEEPTAPDDCVGHAAIRKALKPYGIGVATGEHSHNRMNFKQLLQLDAIDVCQIDSCRTSGVNEILTILLMAAKFGVPVCPHSGGVGLCEYTIHLSLIDYIAVSGDMDRNVLEFVDHLHENFLYPCSINADGRYNVPLNPNEGYSIEMYPKSMEEFAFPNGAYWVKAARGGAATEAQHRLAGQAVH